MILAAMGAATGALHRSMAALVGPVRVLAFLLACAVAQTAGSAQAQVVTLQLDEARGVARQALAAGRPDVARGIALGLLQADPSDFAAHALLSAAETMSGNPRAGVQAGRRAWKAAQHEPQRYEAATLTASALTRDGRPGAARFWLRRAGQTAPTEQYREVARRNFRAVDQQARLSTSFSFAIAPSSNVNNGSRQDTIIIMGLPFTLSPDAQALSGGTASAGVSLRYRLHERRDAVTELRAAVFYRHVWLSDAAQAAAPTARGADYAFGAVEVGLHHRRVAGSGSGVVSFGATLGHNWYGGRDLSDYLRLDTGFEQPLNDRTTLQLGLGYERQWRLDGADRNADIVTATAGLSRALRSGDQMKLTLTLRNTAATAADIGHGAAGLRAGFARAQPVAGMRLSMGLGAEGRDYGPTPLAPSGRRDLRIDGTLSVMFDRVDYMGFAPVLDLRAQRNLSNVPLYDAADFGVTLGLRSTF